MSLTYSASCFPIYVTVCPFCQLWTQQQVTFVHNFICITYDTHRTCFDNDSIKMVDQTVMVYYAKFNQLLLLENQKQFLWYSSILFLNVLMAVGGRAFLDDLWTRIFAGQEDVGLMQVCIFFTLNRLAVCVLVTFDTAMPRDPLEGNSFTFTF